MSPFCEICEKPFLARGDHHADCIICGNECCATCIDKDRICKGCDTQDKHDGASQVTPPAGKNNLSVMASDQNESR